MNKLHFPARNHFDQTLRLKVEAYIKNNNLKQTGTKFLHAKAFVTLFICLVCYGELVFNCSSVISALVLTFIFIQCQILLAFNVMHDGNHGSFSSKKWLNTLASYTMEFLGSSSMLWRQKHNNLHHTYTNVAGKDDDLDVGGMIRLSPDMPYKPWHRFQHFYAPFLYGFLSLYLLFYSDFQRMITGKIGDTPLQQYRKKDLVIFITSKIIYLFVTLGLPIILHPVWVVIGYFIFAHVVFGLTLSIVFQLAHTVSETAFPVSNEKGDMPFSWGEHQLHTTANFAPTNKFVTFYCGGLNYQIEHHLFHRLSHVHYPKISFIIKQTCEEFNQPYHVSPSFWHALKSHFTFLKTMGQNKTIH